MACIASGIANAKTRYGISLLYFKANSKKGIVVTA